MKSRRARPVRSVSGSHELPRVGPRAPAPSPLVDGPRVVGSPEVPRVRDAITAMVVLALVGVLVARAWGGWGPRSSATSRVTMDAPPVAPRTLEGPARSGEIDAREIALPLPAEYVYPDQCSASQEPWIFNGRDLASLSRLARDADVAAPLVAQIRAGSRCDARGCIVVPTPEVIWSLAPTSRDALYRELSRFPENRLHFDAPTRPSTFGGWTDDPRLSPFVRELMGRVTWNHQGRYAFSDLAWLCSQLRTEAERREAIVVLYTRYGLDASVRVPPTGDLEPLVRYWSAGNDPDETRATLERARSNGGRAPVASLLPPMARARLNHFPRPTDLEYDCFWSAVHFFDGATPSDEFPGPLNIGPMLRRAYREIPLGDARLGDVIALHSATGVVIHTANLVAGDVVFTKNGRTRTTPWSLMHLGDMMHAYRFTSPRAYRLH